MLLELLLRWTHVISAVILAGGFIFWRWALIPALGSLDGGLRDQLQSSMRRRWAMVVGITSGLLLISGLFNAVRSIKLYELLPIYHTLVLVKLILAGVLFYVAAKLCGRSESARQFQQKTTAWLDLCVRLSLLLVVIGGYMKVVPHPLKADTAIVPTVSDDLPAERPVDAGNDP